MNYITELINVSQVIISMNGVHREEGVPNAEKNKLFSWTARVGYLFVTYIKQIYSGYFEVGDA